MTCELLSNAGFFSGLWAGLTAIFSLIADIFWDFEIYDKCQDSFGYDIGFVIGFLAFGYFAVVLSFYVFIILLVVWLLTLLFVPIMWGLGIGIGVIFALLLFGFPKSESSFWKKK